MKLVVCGCSYSDYTRVHLTYGEHLSKLIDADYVHLAKGGSSNDRIWRTVSSMVLQEHIKPGDLVLIQYTDLHRREFPSTISNSQELSVFSKPEKIQSLLNAEKYYFISDYKIDSYTWQTYDHDKKMHLQYQTSCVSEVFDENNFYLRHNQFASLCKSYGINVILFNTRYMDSALLGWSNVKFPFPIIDEDSFLKIRQGDSWKYELGYSVNEPLVWDTAHLNHQGHIYVAECLHQAFGELGVI